MILKTLFNHTVVGYDQCTIEKLYGKCNCTIFILRTNSDRKEIVNVVINNFIHGRIVYGTMDRYPLPGQYLGSVIV